MDYFPDRNELLNGLNTWMKLRGVENFKKEVYEPFLTKCQEFQVEPISYAQLTKVKNGHTAEVKYRQMRALIAALKIDDWPRFLDLCHPPSLGDVIPIGPSDCETRLVRSVTNPKTIPVSCVPPDTLGKIRTRLDIVKMQKGQSTEFKPYHGHEYVHVIKGRVFCKFSDGKLTKRITLFGSEDEDRETDAKFAVAFAAALCHSFKCLTDVTMYVARGAKSLPKGIQ